MSGAAMRVDELASASSWYEYAALAGKLKAPAVEKKAAAEGVVQTKEAKKADAPAEKVGAAGSSAKGADKKVAATKSAPAAPAAKPKYVPPPVHEAPRQKRAPLAGPKLPLPGQDNILVTSALPYVNNVPHLGNIIGCVLSADVYARYCRQRGRNCVYICGTDEYGTATETKAQEEGMSCRAVCDKYHAEHKAVYDWFDIAFDYFGRTSTPDPWHDQGWPQTEICQEIFQDNMAAGNCMEDTVEQVYCLQCSKFLADRFIEGECPLCHYDDARGDQCDKCGQLLSATDLLKPRCKAGKEHTVEVRTSRHLFLDLPKLTPKLEAWINQSSKGGEWTANAVQITYSWLREGLKPRCITRDLKWGTPVPHPGFQDKVFYVWFDAPIGYISMAANYTPDWRKWFMAGSVGGAGQGDTTAPVKLYQFMGKDNVPFHTVIFPASLIGTGKPWTLLHHVSTTEYLNYESGKFSKSRGVGVFGDSAKETGIPSEVWRYYLLANRPEISDSVFIWSDFAEKANNELLKNLGNFVNRALNFAWANFEGSITSVPAQEYTPREQELVQAVNALLGEYNSAMSAVKLKAGLRGMMEVSTVANGYMQDCKPWEVKASEPARCAAVIGVAVALVRLLSALAEPFMPGFTDKVVHILGLPHMDIPDAFVPSDIIPAGTKLANKPQPLFGAVTEEQVAHYRERFGGSQAEQALAAAAAAEADAGGTASGAGAAPAGADKKGKPGSKSGSAKEKSSSAGGAGAVDLSSLPDAARIDLRVGKILRAWPHPEADKLWCEEVDVGEEKPRMIASGLRQYYNEEGMTGRHICVVCNLKPRPMVGFESMGMVLCASNADRSVVEFVEPPAGAKIGERLTLPGIITADAPWPVPEVVNPAKKGNPWTNFAAELRTNGDKVATYMGVPLTTSAGPCTAPTQADAPIS